MSVLDTIDYGAFSKDPTADNAREAFQKTDNNFTALNTDKAELSGDTFTGAIALSVTPDLSLLGDAVNRIIRFRSAALQSRFNLFVDNVAESGANAGSNLNLFRYDDAGTSLDSVLLVTRSSGLTKMKGIYTNTTASAANIFVSPDGSILRSTSSEKFKEILEEIKPEFSENIYEIAKKCTLFYKSKSENDNPEWTWYGLSAEKIAEIEPRLVHWGYFDEDYEIVEKEVIRKVKVKDKKTGKVSEKEVKEIEKERVLKKDAKLSPVGVQYERFIPLMLVEMNRQKDELESLKKDVAELKELLKK